MKIELKSITRNARLSEETHCYSASLYVDGLEVAKVGNRGYGGPDEVWPKTGREELLAKAEAFIKAMPPLPSEFSPEGLPMDLELWCGLELDKWLLEKDVIRTFRRSIKCKVLWEENGKLMTTGFRATKEVCKPHFDFVAKEHPTARILNTLPEAEALSIFRKHVVKA